MGDAFESTLARLLRRLAAPTDCRLFNPYRDRHADLDLARGAAIRRKNLRLYLTKFRRARVVLVGEAAGYNGCRFSGIPFTGEDLLVGDKPLAWTRGLPLARSSRDRALSSERSANIVWSGLGRRNTAVLWNAVPWHPHLPENPLSNRKPTRADVDAGLVLLPLLLELYPKATTIAVGRVAEDALARLGIDATYVRHPSMGGKNAFLAGLAQLV